MVAFTDTIHGHDWQDSKGGEGTIFISLYRLTPAYGIQTFTFKLQANHKPSALIIQIC